MLKLINMACDGGESLIVDITCGTGTTAVSFYFCKTSFEIVANDKLTFSQVAAAKASLIDERVDCNNYPRNFKVVLIDKEKTQIDAATERMMTWTENLEEEGVVEEEVDEPVEDADYDSNEESSSEPQDEDNSQGSSRFEADNNSLEM